MFVLKNGIRRHPKPARKRDVVVDKVPRKVYKNLQPFVCCAARGDSDPRNKTQKSCLLEPLKCLLYMYMRLCFLFVLFEFFCMYVCLLCTHKHRAEQSIHFPFLLHCSSTHYQKCAFNRPSRTILRRTINILRDKFLRLL